MSSWGEGVVPHPSSYPRDPAAPLALNDRLINAAGMTGYVNEINCACSRAYRISTSCYSLFKRAQWQSHFVVVSRVSVTTWGTHRIPYQEEAAADGLNVATESEVLYRSRIPPKHRTFVLDCSQLPRY